MKRCLKFLNCAVVGIALTWQADLNAMFHERTIDVGDGTVIKISGTDMKAMFNEANKISTIYKNVIEATSPEEKFLELSVIHDVIPNVMDSNEEVKKISNVFSSYHMLRRFIICSADELREKDAEFIAEEIFINWIFNQFSEKTPWFMGQSFKNLRNKAIYDPEGFKEEFIAFFEQPIEDMTNKIDVAQTQYPDYEDFLEAVFNYSYYTASRYYKVVCSAEELRNLDAQFIAEHIFIDRIFDKISAKSSLFMGHPIKNLRNEVVYDPEGFKRKFIAFFEQPEENILSMVEATKQQYPEFLDLIYDLLNEASYRIRLMKLVAATPFDRIFGTNE